MDSSPRFIEIRPSIILLILIVFLTTLSLVPHFIMQPDSPAPTMETGSTVTNQYEHTTTELVLNSTHGTVIQLTHTETVPDCQQNYTND
jgi:hypothetical protein